MLERRLRLGLLLELLFVVLLVARSFLWIRWLVSSDEATVLSSSIPAASRWIGLALLVCVALTGIWLDSQARGLPRAPTVRRTGLVHWLTVVEAWIPGGVLAMACIVNFFMFLTSRGDAAFLAAVCFVSVLTAVSAASLARRVRDFDRFRAGCIDVPPRVRLGPGAVWLLWILVAGACWLAALGIRRVGPYYEGFDIRTVRALLIGSAIVWFIELGSVRRALRRWSDG